MQHCNVLISSAGRRNYLVSWFREALEANGIDGRIVVGDADENAAARVEGDSFCLLPSIKSPDYPAALIEVCTSNGIRIALSVNDHELSLWSTLDRSIFNELGVTIVALPAKIQQFVEDKLLMSQSFLKSGILVPATQTGASVISGQVELDSLGDRLIVKNRFGSGSSGLTFSRPSALIEDVQTAARQARNRLGVHVSNPREGLECVVVQTLIDGIEYGVDVVNDMSSEFATVLVRKKLQMRSGETDQAVSERPDRFYPLGKALSVVLSHLGTVDTDVIEDINGQQWLIDVNPRFGGGYPFSHMAGANIPAAYVAWASGQQADSDWLASHPGVLSSKFVGISKVRVVHE